MALAWLWALSALTLLQTWRPWGSSGVKLSLQCVPLSTTLIAPLNTF